MRYLPAGREPDVSVQIAAPAPGAVTDPVETLYRSAIVNLLPIVSGTGNVLSGCERVRFMSDFVNLVERGCPQATLEPPHPRLDGWPPFSEGSRPRLRRHARLVDERMQYCLGTRRLHVRELL